MVRTPQYPTDATSLPGWLLVAAETSVPPPVESRLQELPFDQLSWQNFEKLCYRLARNEADVECCRIYGETGEEQNGIDIYAKRGGRDRWTVYQCKRVRDFGPSLIENAAREFLDGTLVATTECFVLCTSESMRLTTRLHAIERIRGELDQRGVRLEIWDALELSTKLKKHPLLVADFFNHTWARCFCVSVPGDLSQRLSAEDFGQFRRECREFYDQCFALADSGWIASRHGGRAIPPLARRFARRDIIEKRSVAPTDEPTEQQPPPQIGDTSQQDIRERTQSARRPRPRRIAEVRTSLESWLAHGGQFVLAGEPGAGKSTVLRFLALDVLSDSPTLTTVAAAWEDYLPVWVPFALWTRRISERGEKVVSLVDLLREWFTSYSNTHLWPLVERALADQRLLLLVDGLDEWRDEPAARVALQLLQVFVGQRKTPAVLVGRPQGLAILGPFPASYREASLAPLDRAQQRELVKRLLDAGEASATQVDAFFRDLAQLPALRSIAGTPLLLGLLLRQHLEHARLPVSRFRAGERMIEALLRDHPSRRQQAALVCVAPLVAERELRETLACVAWRVHTERPEGLVEGEIIREWMESFLADVDGGHGYPRLEARRIADDLLRHGEREFGIIVERAPRLFDFFHRTVQEFLAAEFLGILDRATQLATLRERAAQPHWREVLLAWCHRRSPSEFAEIVSTLETLAEGSEIPDRYQIVELLTELSTGDFPMPTSLSRRLVGMAIEIVWTCEWPHHRRRLLDLVLDGLHGTHAVRSIVQAAVRRWYPARIGARYSLAAKTLAWRSSPELVEALFRTLHHEEEIAQRAAAEALGSHSIDQPRLIDRLAHLAETSIRPITRACALEALARARIDDARLIDLTERERRSGSAEVAITAIAIRVRKKIQTAHDLKILLRLARRTSSHVHYHWRADITEALLTGWPNSPIVKISAMRSLANDRKQERNTIDHEIAFPVLIRGFSGDDDAAVTLAGFFRDDHAFGRMIHDVREWLPKHSRWFGTHPKVAQAVEAYLFRDTSNDSYRVAQAAFLARTDRVKKYLLDALSKDVSLVHWPAWALIECWGVDDFDVASKLREVIHARPESVMDLAALIPRIFPDGNEARNMLLRCLETPKISWPWLLLQGLVVCDGHLRMPDVMEGIFRMADRASEWERKGMRSYFIEHVAEDARVREMALAELDDHEGELPSVAKSFGHDAEIRDRLIAVLAPLPTDLRSVVVDRIEALPVGDSFADDMLALFDSECDSEVKARAAVAHARRIRASGMLTPSFVLRLRSLLHAVGSDNEERRQAALACLIELREFDTIRDEFTGRFSDGSRLINDSLLHNDETLPRQLAKHWSDLRLTLGEDAFAEFTHQDSPLSFAHKFAPFVEIGRPESDWLQGVFSTAERDGISFRLLDYLAQTEPGSERLLTLSIGVIRGKLQTPLFQQDDQMQIAALVAAQWSEDPDVLMRITSGLDCSRLPEPVVIALSLGWPQSQQLSAYFEACVEDGRRVSWYVWHALKAAKSSPARFAETLVRYAQIRGGEIAYIFRQVADCYLARLQRDDEAKRSLLSALGHAKSPDVRVTLAGLISRASPGWSEFRQWRSRETSGTDTGHARSEFGLNLASSNIENLFALLTSGQD